MAWFSLALYSAYWNRVKSVNILFLIRTQYEPVCIIFNSSCLIHLNGCQGVLHGLVDDRVDGADEEVERSEKLLTVLGQVPLGLGVVKKFLLKLWWFMSKVGETFTKRILQELTQLATQVSLTLMGLGFWMLLEGGGAASTSRSLHCEKTKSIFGFSEFIMNQENSRNMWSPAPFLHGEMDVWKKCGLNQPSIRVNTLFQCFLRFAQGENSSLIWTYFSDTLKMFIHFLRVNIYTCVWTMLKKCPLKVFASRRIFAYFLWVSRRTSICSSSSGSTVLLVFPRIKCCFIPNPFKLSLIKSKNMLQIKENDKGSFKITSTRQD